ncbi:MAG: hypothetical protein Q8P67_27240, partial [archaeon]|nr:hypothetical protein [archaeon]
AAPEASRPSRRRGLRSSGSSPSPVNPPEISLVPSVATPTRVRHRGTSTRRRNQRFNVLETSSQETLSSSAPIEPLKYSTNEASQPLSMSDRPAALLEKPRQASAPMVIPSASPASRKLSFNFSALLRSSDNNLAGQLSCSADGHSRVSQLSSSADGSKDLNSPRPRTQSLNPQTSTTMVSKNRSLESASLFGFVLFPRSKPSLKPAESISSSIILIPTLEPSDSPAPSPKRTWFPFFKKN